MPIHEACHEISEEFIKIINGEISFLYIHIYLNTYYIEQLNDRNIKHTKTKLL